MTMAMAATTATTTTTMAIGLGYSCSELDPGRSSISFPSCGTFKEAKNGEC